MLRLVDIWWVSIGEFHGKNSIAPYVDLGIVASLSSYQLGRHPADRTHLGRPNVPLLRQLGRIAKIGQFHLPVFVNENVVRLDIPMNDVLLVEVVQAEQRLPQNVLAAILTIHGQHFGNYWRQSVVHNLNKDPKHVLIVERFEYFEHNVVITAHVHQCHLIQHQLLFPLVFQIADQFQSTNFLV